MEDEDSIPIPECWRPTLCAVVEAFVTGDYALISKIEDVDQVPSETADQIKDYIADYGETICLLPTETWESSIAQQDSENQWTVIVDLWTEESGQSDMVLHGIMNTNEDAFRFRVLLVYVP